MRQLQHVRTLLLVAAGGLLSLVGSLAAAGQVFPAVVAGLAGMLGLALYGFLSPELRLFPKREQSEIESAQRRGDQDVDADDGV